MPTIAHISDLHLQSGVPARQKQVEPILQKINDLKPDLVVISGDVTDDGWDSVHELKWAKTWLEDRIERDWFAVPGNHDVGNFVSLDEGQITQARINDWNNVFDPLPFRSVGLWRIHGNNSMIYGTMLEAYPPSMASNIAEMSSTGSYHALFQHSPLFVNAPDECDDQDAEYWLGPKIGRLGAMAATQAISPRLIASGHVHQTRLTEVDGVKIVWAPPASGTWVHAPGLPNPPMPERTGFFLHTLHDDGRVESELVECAPMLKLYHHEP